VDYLINRRCHSDAFGFVFYAALGALSFLFGFLDGGISRGNLSYGAVLSFHSEGHGKYGKIEHGNKLKL